MGYHSEGTGQVSTGITVRAQGRAEAWGVTVRAQGRCLGVSQ